MILKIFAEYPPRKRLGILAILLGVISIFAGSPFDKVDVKINAKEMSLISADDISKIKVEELADDIIKSKYDYRLIDLRKSKKYEKYNIPSSENIAVDQILNSDLARNEKILLYSDNDIESTQAWFLLKANSYKGINILEGGLKSWQSKILFPACTCGESPTKEQQHKHDKLTAVSNFFGGKIQTGTTSEAITTEMPELKAPTKITLKKSSGKKKREGC
jgi:rhodanese-related sulfurtransferase